MCSPYSVPVLEDECQPPVLEVPEEPCETTFTISALDPQGIDRMSLRFFAFLTSTSLAALRQATAPSTPVKTSPSKKTAGYSKAQKQFALVKTEIGEFEVDTMKFDVDRAAGPDSTNCRMLGEPCQGAHEPAPQGGSPTGSNAWAYWVATVACQRCQLRLLNVPSYGSHGLTCQAGPLPSDSKSKVKELGNDARPTTRTSATSKWDSTQRRNPCRNDWQRFASRRPSTRQLPCPRVQTRPKVTCRILQRPR